MPEWPRPGFAVPAYRVSGSGTAAPEPGSDLSDSARIWTRRRMEPVGRRGRDRDSDCLGDALGGTMRSSHKTIRSLPFYCGALLKILPLG